ncbi:DUF421 domain-containing protein [Mucilaginibacter litoreus]|uniref:DUF421 domain-containing protein n=1 Tax=Mucilaginibacter litoreus TaxID=1048221 RepID=A0ABW3ASX8_9SPHI
MDLLIKIFGEGKDLTVYQMSARAVVIYFIAMALIRISGKRTFAKKTGFDTIIQIIFGAVLSRAIVGASPFWSTVGACLAMVILHRALAWLITKRKWVDKFIKGDREVLFENGRIHEQNLRKCLMTQDDLMSDVRLKANTEDYNDVDKIYRENTGELSVVKKKK